MKIQHNLTIIINKEEMKKKSFKVSNDSGGGTSLMGYLNTSFENIVKVFGKPSFDSLSGDNKVRVEWTIKFNDGTIATIYDWKNYNMSNDDVKKNEKDWHVGGKSDKAFLRVVDEMKKVFVKVVTKKEAYREVTIIK